MRIAKRYLFPVFLLALPLCTLSCRTLLKDAFMTPKIRVAEVFLVSNPSADPKAPWEFILTLAVDNPNSYPINVASVAYTAVLGRDTVAEGEHRSDLLLEASKVTMVKFPLAVRPEGFQAALRHVAETRRISYEFNGSVGLLAPVAGVIRIPFSKTGTIDPLDLLLKKGFGFN